MADGNKRVRLHITPFRRDLLERFVPTSLQAQASNISFHTIETFPEKGFGYVELPVMDAQKLRNKLNGTTLKGAKVAIEEARPERKRKSGDAVEENYDGKDTRKKAKKEKRKKKEEGVISGFELEQGRHVKRGWSEKAGSKKAKKDKGKIDDRKMKFKTEVPPNRLEKEKEKKESQTKEKTATTGKNGKKATVVKEFSRSTRPSSTAATRRDGAKEPVNYEEGVGWVDDTGKVVEQERPLKRRNQNKPDKTAEPEPAHAHPSEPEPDQNTKAPIAAQEDSSELSSSSSASEASSVVSDTSGSEDDDDDDNKTDGDGDDVDRQLDEAKNNTASNAAAERDRNHSIALPSAEQEAETKEIHPLEALFKRSISTAEGGTEKPKIPTPIDTSFNFFSAGDDEEDEEMGASNVPQTPRTKQDLEWRGMRSAAPTPDTAAIGKRFDFAFRGDGHEEEEEEEEEEDGEEEEDADMPDADSPHARGRRNTLAAEEGEGDGGGGGGGGGGSGEREESEFRKWFYDNRGDLNRGWKRRRREERKIVRQRENRRLSRRVA